jgi:hypothetical protein
MPATFLRDLAERVIATYVQAFLGLLVAGTFTLNISTFKAAAIAAIPAAFSAAKGVIASRVGSPGSASLDPSLAAVRVGPGE